MMNELQTLYNIIGAGIAATLGWFAKELWDAVKELKQDLAKLREELPKTYMPKTDLEPVFRSINNKLDRIEDKLDGKVDKK